MQVEEVVPIQNGSLVRYKRMQQKSCIEDVFVRARYPEKSEDSRDVCPKQSIIMLMASLHLTENRFILVNNHKAWVNREKGSLFW